MVRVVFEAFFLGDRLGKFGELFLNSNLPIVDVFCEVFFNSCEIYFWCTFLFAQYLYFAASEHCLFVKETCGSRIICYVYERAQEDTIIKHWPILIAQ